MRNAESDVLDAIDLLVDEQLANYPNRSGYDYDVNQPTCSVCRGEFHGLEDEDTGCPGMLATEEEIATYTPVVCSFTDTFERSGSDLGSNWSQTYEDDGSGYSATPYLGFGMRAGSLRGPRVRFWCTGEDGELRSVEGTLEINQHRLAGGLTTIEGHLHPPIIQRMVPASEVLQEALEEADVSVTAQIWVRGQEEAAQNVRPVSEIDESLLSLEAASLPGEGFQPVGFIGPDDLQIQTDVDFVETWGGRTVQTRQSTSVQFTTCEPGPAFDRLWESAMA